MAAAARVIGGVMAHPFNKGARLQALWRLGRWQIGARLAPGPILVDLVDDTRLVVRPGMTGATGAVYNGLHEFDDMAFVMHVLRAGDLFVDVGANVGVYTLLAANSGARVIALEPDADTARSLRLNIRVNDLAARVEVMEDAAGRFGGAATFSVSKGAENHVLRPDDAPSAGRVVPMITVDNLLATQAPVVIKVDVEGYEQEVIAGAARTLAASSLLAVLLETNGSSARYGVDEAQLHHTMLEVGFQAYAYDGLQRRLSPCDGPNRQGANTLYISDLARVQARIHLAPRRRVLNRLI